MIPVSFMGKVNQRTVFESLIHNLPLEWNIHRWYPTRDTIYGPYIVFYVTKGAKVFHQKFLLSLTEICSIIVVSMKGWYFYDTSIFILFLFPNEETPLLKVLMLLIPVYCSRHDFKEEERRQLSCIEV